MSSTGEAPNGETGPFGAGISADGRFAFFSSRATNLIPNDTNGSFQDVFVHDRLTGLTEIVSVCSSGAQGDFDNSGGDISDDGRFVALAAFSAVVPGDTKGLPDVYVRDRLAGVTVLVSVTFDGRVADNSSSGGRLSADGRLVTFDSNAALIPEDTNTCNDVYVGDLVAGSPCSSACPPRGSRRTAAATVTVEVRPIAAGTITNTVRVGGVQPDPDRNNNTDVEITTIVMP